MKRLSALTFALLLPVLMPAPPADIAPVPGRGTAAPGDGSGSGPAQPGEVQRLAYTMSFLGIPVARAILDEVRPAAPGGEWIVRGAARTTAFWEQFTHIHNAYLTRFTLPGCEPSVYERDIDEKDLRFLSLQHYRPAGDSGADYRRDENSPDRAGTRAGHDNLPPLPERYAAGGHPGAPEISAAPAGRHNFFSALWWARYADWVRTTQARLDLRVEGEPWRLTLRRDGEELQRAPEGRVRTWRIVCTLQRQDQPAASTAGTGSAGSDRTHRSDYVTRHLIREDVEITFWIEQAPERRPIDIRVRMPKYSVRGSLRGPFRDEELDPGLPGAGFQR